VWVLPFTDEFAGTTFDFMLSNPPYGKSWASELKFIKDGKDIIDPRFQIKLKNYWGIEEDADATPRSSDGQLLFLMEMVNKMKPLTQSPLGSRIASVHNGSVAFLQAMPVVAKAISAGILLKTIGWKPLCKCPTTCFTIQALPPISGF
jgi:type I restriction-modification system DNA methylase subunit